MDKVKIFQARKLDIPRCNHKGCNKPAEFSIQHSDDNTDLLCKRHYAIQVSNIKKEGNEVHLNEVANADVPLYSSKFYANQPNKPVANKKWKGTMKLHHDCDMIIHAAETFEYSEL